MTPAPAVAPAIGPAHRRRLRALWRSVGWPFQDGIEIDLLADLRRPANSEAYRWLSSECWYVIREGIAQPQEIPEVYGVMLAQPGGALAVARPAPRRAFELPFGVGMALARATPERLDEEAQQALGHGDAEPDGDGTPG